MSRHVLPVNQAGLVAGGPRFAEIDGLVVRDGATGLLWPRLANALGYPAGWAQALEAVADLNRQRFCGRSDWRLPNRRELRSLVDHGAKNPALPEGHPFREVFLGWYWTSTTKTGQSAYAWSVHFEGGRMFFGRKSDARLVWPVSGESLVLAATGQRLCYDAAGAGVACPGTGQDAELRSGAVWPEPRFERTALGQLDNLTGLVWADPAVLPGEPVAWEAALRLAAGFSQALGPGWRLPDVNELESLVDAGAADPALPPGLAGALRAEGFWSSTTSFFDQGFAYVLYVQKGAVGVGFKAKPDFCVWPVLQPG
jgi:hypothetical protein